jgi:hypothetical protein
MGFFQILVYSAVGARKGAAAIKNRALKSGAVVDGNSNDTISALVCNLVQVSKSKLRQKPMKDKNR